MSDGRSVDPKEQTHRHLITAAMEVFADRGFRAPSIQDICKRAGYSRGAFYAHFKDRDELLGAVMEQMLSGFLIESIESKQAGDVTSMIGNFVTAAIGKAWAVDASVRWRFHHSLEACAASETVRLRYLEAVDNMRQRIKAQVLVGQRDGRVRADIDAGIIAGMLIGLAYGGVVMLELGAKYDFSPVAENILKILAPQTKAP